MCWGASGSARWGWRRRRPGSEGVEFTDMDESIFKKHKWLGVVVGVALLALMGFTYQQLTSASHSTRSRPPEMNMVRITPLPSTPPPPPPPPPPVDQPKIEPNPADQNEEKPDDSPKDEPPDSALGTNLKGDGPPDGFGLAHGNGMGRMGGGPGGAGAKARWARYGSKVQGRIADALRSHPKLRSASLRVEVKVWPDGEGRITRAALASSTGDPQLDAALTGEVLKGLQLQEPPPEGMPTPIVLRLNARRPN